MPWASGWWRSRAWTLQGAPLQPCGRCRQLLYEFGGEELLLDGPDGTPMTMTEILPWAFGPQHLEDTK